MFVVPGVSPVTMPVPLTVATPPAVLHVPIDGVPLSDALVPTHIVAVPLMDGNELTVTTAVRTQPAPTL